MPLRQPSKATGLNREVNSGQILSVFSRRKPGGLRRSATSCDLGSLGRSGLHGARQPAGCGSAQDDWRPGSHIQIDDVQPAQVHADLRRQEQESEDRRTDRHVGENAAT